MYVDIVPNRSSPPAILLRSSRREDGRVIKQTHANLSGVVTLEQARLLQAMLRGDPVVAPTDRFEKVKDRSYGAIEALRIALDRLGLAKLIGSRPTPERDLVLAMIAARVLMPQSKLATVRAWETTALAEEFGVVGANEKQLYGAMDWLLERQEAIEQKLAARHLKEGGLVLYDLSSSYFEGETCPLAKRGYSRDGCPGTLQVNYGLMTDGDGRPISVTVFEGNIGDPKTLKGQVEKLQKTYGLKTVVLVGDRGMISQKHIQSFSKDEGLNWITALKSVQIKPLLEEGVIQLGLFDQRNLFEFTHEDYPGERLVACLNPDLAKRRAHKRTELIEATKAALERIKQRVAKGRLKKKEEIGVAAGKVVGKYKMAKHFELRIEDHSFEYRVRDANVQAEARLDGIYVIRTSVGRKELSPDDAVRSYKKLTSVERAFRSMKSVDLKVRPIYHQLENRVRAHILLCMLAYYVEWHMRRAWAPLLFNDENLETDRAQRDPVAAAKPSQDARRKASTKRLPDGTPAHSFSTLLQDLATLVRSTCRLKGAKDDAPTFELVTDRTPSQERALTLLRGLEVYPV